MDIQTLSVHDMMQLRLGDLSDDQLRAMHAVLQPLHTQYLQDYMRRCDDGDYSETEEERCVKYLYVNINNYLEHYSSFELVSSAKVIKKDAGWLLAEQQRAELSKANEAKYAAIYSQQRAAELKAAAHRYIAQGLIVIPRKHDLHKIPAINPSEYTAGGFTTAAEVDKHWSRSNHRYDGISVLTGIPRADGFVPLVIDLDTHGGKDGRAALQQWIQQHPDIIPRQPALCCSTDGGGGLHLHIAVKAAPDALLSAINALQGVDIIARNRAIIMPPTYRPDKEQTYQWMGLYDWAADTITPAEEVPNADNDIYPFSLDARGDYYRLLTALYKRIQAADEVTRKYGRGKIQAKADANGLTYDDLLQALIHQYLG